jgi:hypothetical protein
MEYGRWSIYKRFKIPGVSMRINILFLIILLFIASPVYGGSIMTNDGATVSLPHTQNFNGEEWDAEGYLTADECGGTARRTTANCYSGDCLKVIPPTSACTGGGINGGAVGMGWYSYSGSQTMHWRFLIKFGSYYATGQTSGGGGLINKFLLSDSPTRASILGLNCTGSGSGRYCAWAVLDSDEAYRFRTPPNRGWIEDAVFKVSSTEHVDEWIAVEYALNTSTGIGQLYLWTQDGTYNGILIDDVPLDTGINMNGFYFSYYNSYGESNANNYFLMDELVISTSYIGPPAGFVGGTTPTVTGCTLSGASMQ